MKTGVGMQGRNEFQGKYYHAYSDFIVHKYGERVQKVTVDAGFSCPNRDGTLGAGGCIYCNNASFNPAGNDPAKSISQQIDEGVAFLSRRYKVRKFFVYFQPFTNTYAPLEQLKVYYGEALSHPGVIGLTIGTRPDCIDERKIDYLAELARTYDITIEYGLESIYDETLIKINRQHDFQTYLNAIAMTQDRGIQICTHIILGFPWETQSQWLREADVLSNIAMQFLKIHHLHIVKNTELGRQYVQQPFELISYEQYIDLVCSFLERLNPRIVIQRLFAQTPGELLLAPRWNKTPAEIVHDIEEEFKRRGGWQGKKYRGASVSPPGTTNNLPIS
jgi:radical SAM protein (TIGR01212 family)